MVKSEFEEDDGSLPGIDEEEDIMLAYMNEVAQHHVLKQWQEKDRGIKYMIGSTLRALKEELQTSGQTADPITIVLSLIRKIQEYELLCELFSAGLNLSQTMTLEQIVTSQHFIAGLEGQLNSNLIKLLASGSGKSEYEVEADLRKIYIYIKLMPTDVLDRMADIPRRSGLSDSQRQAIIVQLLQNQKPRLAARFKKIESEGECM